MVNTSNGSGYFINNFFNKLPSGRYKPNRMARDKGYLPRDRPCLKIVPAVKTTEKISLHSKQ